MKVKDTIPEDLGLVAQLDVYPGGYEPLPGTTKTLEEALHRSSTIIVEPPLDFFDLPDHYRIEMQVPGCTKEDIFIKTGHCRLSISAIVKQTATGYDEYCPNRQYTYTCLKRQIELPNDVDPDFATAQYVNGVLRICLFKTRYPAVVGPGYMVVY